MSKNLAIDPNKVPGTFGQETPRETTPRNCVPNVVPMVQEEREAESKEIKKPLKASDLDFSKFPKANRLDASEFAERSLNEVKDLAREFNKDFPHTPYIVDYDSFPRPETYTPKQYGGKDRAYIAWKSAVKEWVEDCKQDMDARKDIGLTNLAAQFEIKVDRNFITMCSQFGITVQMLQNMFEEAKGDMNSFKELVNKARNAIIANNNRNTSAVIFNENANAAGIHAHINDVDYASSRRDEVLSEKVEEVRTNTEEIKDNVDEIKDGVKAANEKLDEQKERENLIKKIGIAWHNSPGKTERILRNVLIEKGYKFDKDGMVIPPFPVTIPLPTKDNTIQTVIENLSLDELKELRNALKIKEKDPLVKPDRKDKSTYEKTTEILVESALGIGGKAVKEAVEKLEE